MLKVYSMKNSQIKHMVKDPSNSFLSDCSVLHSFLANPDLKHRLKVVSDRTNKATPEPLEFWGSMLTLSRFDDPDTIGYSLPRLGDPEQHYMITTRFNSPLTAGVLRLLHCRNCVEKDICKPKIQQTEGLTSVTGLVLANHHFT